MYESVFKTETKEQEIKRYEKYGKTDACFRYAAKFLKGEVQKPEDLEAMKELNRAVSDKDMTQVEIAKYLGMSQNKLSEIINRYKNHIDYKYLTQQVRQL